MEDDLPVAISSPTSTATALPSPTDELHAVGARLDEQRVLACAASRDELAGLSPGVVSLTPQSLPPGVPNAHTIDPRSLNLLIHAFEPLPLRRERRRRSVVLFASGLALALIAALGLWRRASVWNEAARSAESVSRELLARIVPSVDASIGPSQREAMLQQERTRLRQTRWTTGTPSADASQARDATDALANYLALWPRDAKVRTEFLTVTPSSIALAIRSLRAAAGEVGKDVHTDGFGGEPSTLIGKLPRPTGWTMDEPRLSARGTETSLSIQLRRVDGEGGAQ